IAIEVSERGSRVVRRNIEGIGQSARTAQGSLTLLQRSLGFLSAGVIVRGLGQLADSFTNIQNRLRTVTEGQAQLNAVTRELFEISNRTRSSFEGTAEVYARTALAVRELGISQKQTLEFAESLNQAVILSGASAQEAQNALIQLSQGLASGALRGDELRSVLEQLPVVADVIAKELGVTRGELRELGKDGKITADIILEAFQSAQEELATGFGKTVPTIGQSFTVLRNQIVRTVGALDDATGVSRAFSRGLLFVAQNIETVTRAVAALALAIGVQLARRAIPAAVSGFRALAAAIALNPFGALAVAITAATTALIAFSDKIFVAENDLTTLADLGKAVFETIATNARIVVDFIGDTLAPAISSIGGFFSDIIPEVDLTFRGIVTIGARAADAILNAWISLTLAIVAAFQNIGPALGDIFFRAINGLVGIAEAGANKIIDALNAPFEALDLEPIARIQIERFANTFEGGLDRLGERAFEGLVAGQEFTVFEDFVNDAFDRADQIAIERVQNQQKIIAEEQAAFAALETPGERVARPREDEAGKKIKEAREELTGLAAVVEGGVNNAFNTATDAIINFAQTGELEVRQLVTNILAELAKLAFQQGISQLAGGLSGSFGGAGANTVGGAGNIGSVLGSIFAQGFQTGGSFTVGGSGGADSQPVAFRASPGERVTVETPAQQQAADSANAPPGQMDPLNVKIVNVTSPDEVLSIMSSAAGERVINNWLDRNTNEITQRLQR
nr:tape measure protein [Acidimicrobiia bacterium]